MVPPHETRDHAAEGRQRWWRVGQTAAAQMIAKTVSGLCQLVLVPLLISHLGADTFGWMMALFGTTALISFADLGVVIVLQQRLSEKWGAGDTAGLRQIHEDGARLLQRIGAAWLAASAPLACWLGPRFLAAPGGIDVNAQRLAWLIVAATIASGVAASSGQRLALAMQAGWLPTLWAAATNLLMLVGAVIAVSAGAGTVVFLALLGSALVLPNVFSGLHAARRLGWERACAPGADSASVRELWRAGLRFAPLNLAQALVQSGSAPAVVYFGGFGAGAAFAVLTRLFGPFVQIHAMLVTTLWPAYAEAMVRDDRRWIRRTFRYSILVSVAAAAGLLIATAALSAILHMWIGERAIVPAAAFAWLIAGWQAAGMMSQPFIIFLMGQNRLARIANRVALVHLLTLAAVVVAGAAWGELGVAGSLVGGTLLGLVPLLATESALLLRR